MAAISAGTAASAPPPFYFDEKWKLSKKEGSSRSRNSTAPFMKSSSSHRRCSFTRKCARLVKEQRARFYIVRRCVTMLICWRDYSDSWKRVERETGLNFFPLWFYEIVFGFGQNPSLALIDVGGGRGWHIRVYKFLFFVLLDVFWVRFFLSSESPLKETGSWCCCYFHCCLPENRERLKLKENRKLLIQHSKIIDPTTPPLISMFVFFLMGMAVILISLFLIWVSLAIDDWSDGSIKEIFYIFLSLV